MIKNKNTPKIFCLIFAHLWQPFAKIALTLGQNKPLNLIPPTKN
jgi:hypothetical protein